MPGKPTCILETSVCSGSYLIIIFILHANSNALQWRRGVRCVISIHLFIGFLLNAMRDTIVSEYLVLSS